MNREQTDDVHVVPINDLQAHDEHRECWCRPTIIREPDSAVVVVHQAADGRDLVERHGLQ